MRRVNNVALNNNNINNNNNNGNSNHHLPWVVLVVLWLPCYVG